MNLLVLGLNHRTAPLELRERLTLEKDQLAGSLELLAQYVEHGVILSTCNRLEVYVFDRSDIGLVGRVGAFLSAYSGVEGSQLESHLYQLWHEDCAGHLFRVSGGLDSMVVGERQVLGQVRSAFSQASARGYARGPLSRLFHQALRVGRRIHRETDIGLHSRSVSQAGVQLARGILGDLTQQRALVIGAGDAGRLVARALVDAGVRRIAVANRTSWRAEDLARELGGVAVPFDELAAQLSEADVVISSTGSPGYVLDRAAVLAAVQRREQRPLLLIDIAVPRDIDPQAAELDGVQLYDIDALQLVAETDALSLDQAVAQAEAIAAEETAKFLSWWERMDVVPLIAALRGQAEEIRRAEVARTLRNLKKQWPLDWPLDEDGVGLDQLAPHLEAMTSALVKKLLHGPTRHLKETRDPGQQQVVRQLFNLDEPPHTPSGKD